MVFEKIAAIIADKLDIAPGDVSENSSFKDMQIDSLYMVEIMLSVEEEFGVTIDEVGDMETVGDLVAYVEDKINEL